MAQVTIYLDNELEAKLRAAARAANLSQSRWVSGVIEEKLRNEWPTAVAALAGAWADFPDLDDLRQEMGDDVAREPL